MAAESYEGSKVINWRGAIDALGRKADAEFLTNLLLGRFKRESAKGSPASLVLNIDAPWGTGKTFLLEHWGQDLDEEGWIVLRFNAWEHDYAQDPLLRFIAEIQSQVDKRAGSGARAAKAAAKFSKSLVRNLAPAIAKTAVKAGAHVLLGAGALEEIATLVETAKVEDAAAAAIEKAAERMLVQEKAVAQHLKAFKTSLEAFATAARTDGCPAPVLLIVDELDRCRPGFAIDLLEVLKHVFNVPGVYSVVATDTAQLAASATGAYGPQFQAADYLRRFFDLQYKIGEAERQPLAYHLLLDEGLLNDDRLVAPVQMVTGPAKQPGVFDRYGPSGHDHDQAAARTMIVAAIAGRLSLSNRDLLRMVQLLRAAVDSFAAATSRITPLPKLHFFYLAAFAGAYVRTGTPLRAHDELKAMLSNIPASADHRDFWGGADRVPVLQVLDIYGRRTLAERIGESKHHISVDVLNTFRSDPNSFKYLESYSTLISRCGQLVAR